jgi:hypothetical protein
MRAIIAGSLLALLGDTAGAVAAETPHEAAVRAIRTCVRDVHDRAGNTTFEAYLGQGEYPLRSWGSRRDQFLFEKCMYELGHPMGAADPSNGR